MKSKRKCRVCGELLHYLEAINGKTGANQCLNHNCKNYGKAIY